MDDLTNRILIVGVTLLSIFLIFLVILLAWGAPDESIGWVFDLANYLEDHNNTEAKLIITFGGVILMLLASLLIIFEVVPPESNALTVTKAGSGDVQISAEEAVQRLEEELQLLPQVSQARATVFGRGKKAEVHLNLHVTADADLAATADEASQRVRALMEDRMGLELARPPQAEIQYRELRVGQRVEAAPDAAAATPEPPPAARPLAAESQPEPATNPDPDPDPEVSQPPPAIESMRDETTETAEDDRPAGA